jgi:hypothetical protein
MNLRKRNYSCSNIKIGVIELYSNGKEQELGAIVPFPMKPHTTNLSYTNHAFNVITVIRTFAPEAEIFLVPPSHKAVDYLIEKGVHLVNVSLRTFDASWYDRLADKAFIITSGGNDGAEGEYGLATSDRVCAVGAVDSNLKPQSYSSYGKGKIKTCAIVGLNYGTGILHGTSFASPVVTGLLAQWYSWYKSKFNAKPTVSATNEFIKINSHDIWDDGKDVRTGYGLLRLPYEFEATELKIKKDSPIGIKTTYTEGTAKEELVDLLYIPNIQNNRMVLAIADVALTFGQSIVWDGQESIASFIK